MSPVRSTFSSMPEAMTERMMRRADVVDVEAVEIARSRVSTLRHGFKTRGAVFWRSAGLRAFVSGATWCGGLTAGALVFFLCFAVTGPEPVAITWSLLAICGGVIGSTAIWGGAMSMRGV